MDIKKIGILMDTASGDDAKVFEGTNVELLPLHIVFPDGTDVLDTEKNVKETNFYKRVQDGENIKTSQASPGELMIKYEEMLGKYDHIIHLPIPKNLSSMYQTSVMVANDDDFAGKVTVVEHSMAANGLKECALTLNKLLKEGKFKSIDEILEFLKEYEEKMYLGLVAGDLKKLAKGGRAVKLIQTVLNIFKTKVLIKWEETPKKEAMGRTVTAVTEKAVAHIKDYAKDENYKFIFVNTPLTEDKIIDSAIKVLDDLKVKYTREIIPPLYTAHAGTNTIGFVIVKEY